MGDDIDVKSLEQLRAVIQELSGLLVESTDALNALINGHALKTETVQLIVMRSREMLSRLGSPKN